MSQDRLRVCQHKTLTSMRRDFVTLPQVWSGEPQLQGLCRASRYSTRSERTVGFALQLAGLAAARLGRLDGRAANHVDAGLMRSHDARVDRRGRALPGPMVPLPDNEPGV